MSENTPENLVNELLADPVEPVGASESHTEKLDPELAAVESELRDALALLALTSRPAKPSRDLLAEILPGNRKRPAPMSPERKATRGRVQVILPWAIAACLAIGLFIASADRASLFQQIALLQRQVAGFQQQVAGLQQQVASSRQQADGFQQQIVSLQEQVAGFQQQTNLANLKIASLRSQLASLKGSAVTVVWNEAENRGVIKLQDVPAPKPGKDYQLWVVDSEHKLPISAGVVPVSATGLSKVVFKPDQPVRVAQKFVLSLEAAGGAPQPAGPFLFVGS